MKKISAVVFICLCSLLVFTRWRSFSVDDEPSRRAETTPLKRDKTLPSLEEQTPGHDVPYSVDRTNKPSESDDRSLRTLFASLSGIQKMEDLVLLKIELEKELLAHPEYIAEFPALLKEFTGKNKRAEMALIHCLEENPAPEAESMLALIAISEGYPDHQRMQGIVSLGARENLSADGVTALWDIYETQIESSPQFAQAALLNVAVAASQYSDPDSEAAKGIFLQIKDELDSENGRVSTGFILDALGNTARREVLDVVREYLNATDASVRQDAAYALRQVPGEDVDVLLLETAQEETNADARRGAIEALTARVPTDELIAGMGKLLFEETDASLRRAIMRYLGSHQKQFPQAREYIEKLVKIESDDENYEMAVMSLHDS